MQTRRKLKSGLGVTLLCLISIVIAGCGTGNPHPATAHTKAPQNRQVFVSGIINGYTAIATLDPALATDGSSVSPLDLIFTGLVQLDDNLHVTDQLAASHEVMPDGKTYKFTLKPGLKFSDGTPLTSQDVVYSINRALDPATKSPTGPYYLKYIKDSDKLQAGTIKTLIGDSLLAPDPNTVVIITDKVYTFFLDALTYPCSYVVEKSMIDKWGDHWIEHLSDNGGQGTDGPFNVSHFNRSTGIDYIPNPNFYGPKPQLAKVEYPIFKDISTLYQSYQANQVEDDPQLLSTTYEQAKNRPDFYQIPLLEIYYYSMNYTKKPFDNIKIRQAFALAINKDLIMQRVWKNQYFATNHIVPEGMNGYSPNLIGPAGVKGTGGDPTLAKQLLQQGMQEEGYNSIAQLPTITLTYSDLGREAIKEEVAVMQQMWQSVLGINVKVESIDTGVLIQDLGKGSANPLQLYYGTAWTADYPDPENWTTLQFGPGSANNTMSYGQNHAADAVQQQAVQQLMEQADSAPAGADRMAMYNRAEQQLANDVAWLPMAQATLSGLRKPCVQGLKYTAAGRIPPNDWGRIYISTDTPCMKATV
ncbi:peptide ABC transporter substrate-binding protein [Ktedonosporobacter rubrisoli]|uniref:Peptide ABC transporter substrate-binding protein n=1 Tax=Ktedonosporobacter rubrisoli TaxID=2509675 RepID=A0A4P6JKL2_KTERU|nr:peptide ABC transporter substrate-binding protein [Ktedonosporobacter rubrisoli]QBD75502.1 peptide ABC transporter substrate-binding protein [Ktedonosporobacter rubrisoli]